MKLNRIWICAAILALILIAGTLLLFPQAETPAKDAALNRPLKIGYQANSSHLPTLIALDGNYFNEQGLRAEGIKFESANLLIEALVSGQIDVGSGGVPVLFAIEQNAPGQFRIFMVNEMTRQRYYDFILVKKGSSIKNLQELKGKKIGAWPGATLLTYLKIILKENGLNAEDFDIQQIDPKLQAQALAAGQIDALFTLEPIATIALEKGIAEVLIAGALPSFIMEPMPGSAYVVSAKFLKNYPKESEKAMRAIEKAVEYAETNKSDATKVLAKYMQMNEETAAKIHTSPWIPIENSNKRSIQELSDLLYENKMLEKKINTAEMLYK